MTADGVRPTGAEAYRDGTGTFHPPERRLVRPDRDLVVRVDTCVVGSGAGGAVVAKELAEGGMSVALLEEGGWWDTDQFTARPREMTSLLYRDAGQTTTLGRPPILLPLGRGVGGTTLVNSGTCFRTPAPVLERWRTELGLEDMTPQALDPWFRRVERELNVAQVPPEIAGRNAHVVKRGADRLGLSGDFVYRNVRGCVGSGVCNFGCPTGAKQHVGITYVPRAWAAGATSYVGARAERIEVRAGRARAVDARCGRHRLRVECDHIVLACGAIHTPLLLRRNRLGGDSGQLGRNLAIHPATGLRALLDEDVDMWAGVPQSYYVDEYADEGIMLEGAAGPVDYLAMSLPFGGARHRETMLSARRMSQFGVMVSDTARGTVSESFGRPRIRYDVNERDCATFKRAFEALAEIYWAAGAHTVLTPVRSAATLRDGDSRPLREARVTPADLTLMAFHPMGTARAGGHPERSVLDPRLAVRGVAGLHVADGSAVPSSLGVNPQITIMALATRLAFSLLGAPPPDDEPVPERIATPRLTLAHA